MTFSVSNDGIGWFLDFGPDSVTLTVKDIVPEMTISSREILLASSSLLELVVVSKTTVLEQPFGASSSHSQPARNT